MLSALRPRFAQHTAATPTDPAVGRECDASPLSVQGQPSDAMLSWAWSRLGLRSTQIAHHATVEPDPPVDIALIDTGVAPEVAAHVTGIGLTDELSFVPE